MFKTTHIFVCLLLYLFVCKTTNAADPKCSTGKAFRGACCPSKCGQCGGKGCYQRSLQLKTRCCANGILKNEDSCNKSDPPCRIEDTPKSPKTTIEGSWQFADVKAGKVVPRVEACAVMVNGLVVLYGGGGENRPVSIYNPKTNTWTKKKGPGAKVIIHHFQCVAIGSKIWIVSSWTGKYPREENNKNIYIYDVATDKWSTRKGMVSSRLRGAGASVVRGDWIYVVAGNRGGHGAHATSLAWMDAYNWKEDYWTPPGKFADMPGGGRDHVAGAMVNGELCVAGGRDGGVKVFFNAVKKTTYCYNFSSNKWSRRGDLPVPRAGAMTGTICNGLMMIAGGEGNGKAYNRVDVFDGKKWTQAPSLKQARHGSGLAVAQCNKCGHIFIPSGVGNQGGKPKLETTEQFIPKGSPTRCNKY